jgi:hypothetical protein
MGGGAGTLLAAVAPCFIQLLWWGRRLCHRKSMTTLAQNLDRFRDHLLSLFTVPTHPALVGQGKTKTIETLGRKAFTSCEITVAIT